MCTFETTRRSVAYECSGVRQKDKRTRDAMYISTGACYWSKQTQFLEYRFQLIENSENDITDVLAEKRLSVTIILKARTDEKVAITNRMHMRMTEYESFVCALLEAESY